MVHKSRKVEKKFDCGHRGLGQYCHLCEQIKNGIVVVHENGKMETVKK